VVRVSSDVTVSTSYQAAPPNPARFDPSQASDSFGSMLDSNIPPDPPAPPAPPAPQRPPNGSSATADSPAPRDAAPDQPAPGNGPDRGANAQQPDSPAPAASNSSDPKADASSPGGGKASDGKTGAAKTGETKSADTAAKDSAASAAVATDATAGAQANALALIQNPVAVAIPVTVAPAQVPGVVPTPDGAQKPLAIAAAALAVAAATATNASAGAGPTPADTNSGTAVTPVTSEKISAQAASVKPAAGAAAPATQPTVATDTTDIALTAAISGTQTIGGKSAPAKSTPQGQVKTQVTGDGTASPDKSKTAATTEAGLNGAVAQAATGAKPDAVPAAALGAAKPDVSGTIPSATDAVSPHDHVAAGTNAPTSSANTDASLQASTTFQPQAPSTPPIPSAANLTATAATGAAVPLSGLAVEIAASAHSGKTRFDVRLDPADLGRIDVRIDVDRNGQVTSHLRVEKPETLSMLQQDAPQLRQALDDAGLKTGSGGLQFSLRDQSSSGQNNDNTGSNAQRLVISEDDTVPVAIAGRSYGRVLGSNSGVDIRV
jgi:flagellar hook-length control protein FliK